jgi:membrane dipeptidase
MDRGLLVWDGHGCLPLVPDPRSAEGLERYHRAGVDVVSINIGDSDVPLERQVRLAACYRDHVRRHPESYELVATVADVDRVHAEGRLGVVFDVEGAVAIDDQLEIVDVYQTLGVRTMALVYNLANRVGGGCHDAVDEGLTSFGRQLVGRLEGAGIVVDCSHAGYRTAREVINIAQHPVVFSHSNPRVLHDHPRNIPDDLVVACASTGGVVGINGIGIFLGDGDISTGRLIDHIDHVVQLVGAEHVAIGLDFVESADDLTSNFAASPTFWPAGFGYGDDMTWIGPERFPDIVTTMRDRGYDDEAIRAILGGNLRRVAEAVWA